MGARELLHFFGESNEPVFLLTKPPQARELGAVLERLPRRRFHRAPVVIGMLARFQEMTVNAVLIRSRWHRCGRLLCRPPGYRLQPRNDGQEQPTRSNPCRHLHITSEFTIAPHALLP